MIIIVLKIKCNNYLHNLNQYKNLFYIYNRISIFIIKIPKYMFWKINFIIITEAQVALSKFASNLIQPRPWRQQLLSVSLPPYLHSHFQQLNLTIPSIRLFAQILLNQFVSPTEQLLLLPGKFTTTLKSENLSWVVLNFYF